MPQDATRADTKRATTQAEKIIYDQAEKFGQEHKHNGKPKNVVRYMTTFIGGAAPRFWSSAAPEPPKLNYGEVVVETFDKRDTHELVKLWQTALDREVQGRASTCANWRLALP